MYFQVYCAFTYLLLSILFEMNISPHATHKALHKITTRQNKRNEAKRHGQKWFRMCSQYSRSSISMCFPFFTLFFYSINIHLAFHTSVDFDIYNIIRLRQCRFHMYYSIGFVACRHMQNASHHNQYIPNTHTLAAEWEIKPETEKLNGQNDMIERKSVEKRET